MEKENWEKKPDYKKYALWFRDTLDIEIDGKDRIHYNAVVNSLKKNIEESGFWKKLLEKFGEVELEYEREKGYDLFVRSLDGSIYTKSYESFFEKTYRSNILQNKEYPKPPVKGWITPENWFKQINDIVRTIFVVKYLDGVEYLISNINDYCKNNNCASSSVMEARNEGYYAAHIYITLNQEIPKKDWDTENINVIFEIQITTQLQEVIRQLNHKYYESRRLREKTKSTKWEWDYKSEEFSANYLGHILHYLEGMIMEIREKQKKEII